MSTRTVDLQEEILNILKCSLCKNYVSFPPVILSKNGLKQKCGRCQNFFQKDDIRNVYIENIAKVTKFPCIFANCTKKLAWGEAEDHERVCPHTTILCPIDRHLCNENIEIADCPSHYLRRHSDYCLLENFSFINSKYACYTMTRFLVKNKAIYMMYRVQKNNDFWFCLFSLKPIKDKRPSYNLKLTSERSDAALFYNDQPMIQYNEREHCVHCMFGECYLKYHKYSKVYNLANKHESIRTTDINRRQAIQTLKSEDFKVTITITDEEEDSKEPSQRDFSKDISFDNNNSLLRQKLECPICQELMTGPIYTCSTGHSICNVCKPKLSDCPNCKANFGNSRNYSLEEMAECVEMLCQYNKEGCHFIGNVERICQHECNCLYKSES